MNFYFIVAIAFADIIAVSYVRVLKYMLVLIGKIKPIKLV
jgi:hypothetical protein